MMNNLLLISALTGYGIATLFIAKHIRVDEAPNPKLIFQASLLGWFASITHLCLAYTVSFENGSLNFGLSTMAILVSAILVFIFQLASLAMPIRRLGVLVFPLTIFSLIFAHFWHSEPTQAASFSRAMSSHILISIVAYSLLAIAAVQALLYVYQERQIKLRTNPAMLMALPPLQTMELLLFRLVGFGFALLTLTLLSGAVFSQEIFGHPFLFKHHTILAILGWGVFAILLFKRVKHGLRGSQAVAWTIGGFLLIQLGYFGTKIVSETLSLQ